MLAGAVGADSLTNVFNITGQGVGLGLWATTIEI